MRKILSLVILVSVLLLFHNQAANWHYHTLSNGIVVVHAHPYPKTATNNTESPFANHSHSDLELLMIGLISSVLTLVVILLIPTLHGIMFRALRLQFFYNLPFLASRFIGTTPLRGPPFLA